MCLPQGYHSKGRFKPVKQQVLLYVSLRSLFMGLKKADYSLFTKRLSILCGCLSISGWYLVTGNDLQYIIGLQHMVDEKF